MGNRMRKPITKKEANLRRFYQDLMQEGDDLPYKRDYATYANPVLAMRMEFKRSEGGVPALQEYMASLSKTKDPQFKRLIKILLSDSLPTERSAGTLLSDVQPQQIPWLWYPRLALGKITMLDGDPGLGKSLIGADIGARITKGEKMPDGTPCLASGGVVVIMPEDTLQDTILPRFARAGADLSKVVDLSKVEADDCEYEQRYEDEDEDEDEGENDGGNEGKRYIRPFQLQNDLDSLEAAIERVDAKLVYIDPIMALGGDTNMYKDDEVRRLLAPLKMLVERLQVACVIVRHMTKTRSENPLMAGNGSIAFIGLARTGLMVTRNPADKSQMILSHIKSNIGPLAPGITYTIGSDEADERPYLVWGNEREMIPISDKPCRSGELASLSVDPIAAPYKRARK